MLVSREMVTALNTQLIKLRLIQLVKTLLFSNNRFVLYGRGWQLGRFFF